MPFSAGGFANSAWYAIADGFGLPGTAGQAPHAFLLVPYARDPRLSLSFRLFLKKEIHVY
jgi:hypothetical protein